MKLFKYISFKDKEGRANNYWTDPFLKSRLYFSKVNELRGVNDELEFHFTWDSSSWFLNKYSDNLNQTYKAIFDNARILCLSDRHFRSCWAKFCPHGGICYEFDFDATKKRTDVTYRKVDYSESREHDAAKFYLSRINNPEALRILKTEGSPTRNELKWLLEWFNHSRGEWSIFEKHAIDEIAFKKNGMFSNEFEHRFIHIENPVGNVKIETRLLDSTLTLNQLGLTLVGAKTSDPEFVHAILPDLKPIKKPTFL